jgi:hypothetical protein
LVEPGLFRTDFLDASSAKFGQRAIEDYAEQSASLRALYSNLSGQQKGDPRKLAAALLHLTAEDQPPMRFAAGSDACGTVERKINTLTADLNRWRSLSVSTDGDT